VSGQSADDPDGRPWDAALALRIIGKTVLVGITVLAPDGSIADDAEFHGIIVEAHRERGIAIACRGANLGRRRIVPPILGALEPASPGRYRLRSTAETVIDPDYTAMWTVHRRAS